MKILYAARHNNGGNEDEAAIAYALRELGHTVHCVGEEVTGGAAAGYDFTLYNKPMNLDPAMGLHGRKVMYFFDLVQHPDFELGPQTAQRVRWMEHVRHIFDLVFLTDGDCAARHPDRFVHLMQGADERVIGPGKASRVVNNEPFRILFTGGTMHGEGRRTFAEQLKEHYRGRFLHIGDKRQPKLYGRKLANLMATMKIVVCPDTPVTDVYWSNRVYQATGYGAFVLHPRCALLETQYEDGKEIVFYDNRDHLFELIDAYLSPVNDGERCRIAAAGLERVKREHLYRHRCEQLVAEVQRRLP